MARKSKKMSPEQEDNLDYIKHYFEVAVDKKYRKGDAEHGGNLVDLPPSELIRMAIEEAIDQVVYLVTLWRVMK